MADKKVRFINLNNQILTLGGDGILSFPDIATMASEPIANLQNGAIGWVDGEQKYFQWLDTNEISEMGRWKELIFGTDFQIFEYVDPNSEKYVGRIIQYCGETDTSTGFIKGCFYESRLTDKIDYVVVTLSEDAVGTYYTKDDDGNYSPITFNGTGENFDPNEIYYTKQEISLYNWVYINSLKVENVLDLNSQNAISNGAVTAKFEEVREYVDNDLTTSLQQYTDDKIDDTDDGVFEDKTWSSSKINTKFEEVAQTITDGNEALTEYVDTSLEGYEKKFVECTFEEYKQMETDGTIETDVDYVIISNESGALLSDLDTNHGDSEISTYEVIETLKNDVEDITTELKTSENTDIVPITVLSDIPFLSKGDNYCYYKIVNGICYFQLFIDSTADVTTYIELCNSLPKPSLASVYFGFPTFYNINDVYKTLQVYISEDGVMSVNNSTTNASYMLNGSYPIA